MVLGGAVESYWGVKMGLWRLKPPSGMAYWCGTAAAERFWASSQNPILQLHKPMERPWDQAPAPQ